MRHTIISETQFNKIAPNQWCVVSTYADDISSVDGVYMRSEVAKDMKEPPTNYQAFSHWVKNIGGNSFDLIIVDEYATLKTVTITSDD